MEAAEQCCRGVGPSRRGVDVLSLVEFAQRRFEGSGEVQDGDSDDYDDDDDDDDDDDERG